jgi:hypothetical protein
MPKVICAVAQKTLLEKSLGELCLLNFSLSFYLK